ncbi:MAG: carboxypeptidase regulatory-like domain-containing protein, partial [Acidobacteriota bacterium]|nr:carboxypeptidase regulatory-like domain-containing protein [Acidobacteriota bacterium]
LRDFGAVGDGVTDDGPALQRALDALGAAGGGTLTVPAGRYVIASPVHKEFTGLASSVTIQGVPSDATIDVTAAGDVLSRSLGLVSEFHPRTGVQHIALSFQGLQSLLVKDIAFVGTPGVWTDAVTTLALESVEAATLRHCEFYGLLTLTRGHAIVRARRSGLSIEQSKFLGNAGSSAVSVPIVQNSEWKSVALTEVVFLDYGQRPGLFTKTSYGPPYSWVNVGNPAPVTPDSPRREVVMRHVFLDEGGFIGLTCLPANGPPPYVPVDLFYITGLHMNVTNFGSTGHLLSGPRGILVEDSRYGWTRRADSAIRALNAGHVILDRIRTEASATRLRADATVRRMTVVNSIYQELASLAQTTRVINTAPEDDPVWYVRRQFNSVAGRDPDAAAHFYWSDRILRCDDDAACASAQRDALNAYLDTAPAPTFDIAGRVTDEQGAGVAGATVLLTGSQTVKAFTDADGHYRFRNLPTSGVYTVSPSVSLTPATPAQTFATPNGDRTANFAGTPLRYSVAGRLADIAGKPLAGASLLLSGTQSGAATTDADGNYSFPNLIGGGNFTVRPARPGYFFTPAALTFNGLAANRTANFAGTPITYTIGGRVTTGGVGRAGVTLTLSGTHSATATTNANGDYAFAGLTAGGDYTVTPAPNAADAAPSRSSFTSLFANQTANFALYPYVNHARASNGATAVASSYLNVGRAPLAAINGDRRGLHWGSSPSTGGGWHDATTNVFPDWLEVQFAGRRTIREVSVFSVQDEFTAPAEPTPAMTFTTYGLADFNVEYWNGSAWVAVPGGVIVGNNRVWRKLSFAPLSMTKLRVFVKRGLSGHGRVVEVEAWGPASGGSPRINHAAAAQGADVLASSAFDAARHPLAAINGDRRGLHWGTDPTTGSAWTDATRNAYPDILEIVFNGPKKITELSVFGLQDDFAAPVEPTATLVSNNYALVDFRAQYWNGSGWVDLPNGVITGNDKVWRRITFPAVTTHGVRVLVTKALGGHSRITEVEVY